MLSELESQNEEQLTGMGAKVKMLKDVSAALPEGRMSSGVGQVGSGVLTAGQLTQAIGVEIRESTALASDMVRIVLRVLSGFGVARIE